MEVNEHIQICLFGMCVSSTVLTSWFSVLNAVVSDLYILSTTQDVNCMKQKKLETLIQVTWASNWTENITNSFIHPVHWLS